MKKDGKKGRVVILFIIILCALMYIIISNSKKTIKLTYHSYEDKINFNGFYFVDEHVIYNGDTKNIGLKYKTGDLVSKDTRISDNVIANVAGMIITHIDGYENKYNRENIKNVTAKDINNIVLNAKKQSGIKIVDNSEWYVCALLNDDDNKYFKKGMAKDININNKYYTADIIDIFRKDGSVILVLRFKNDLDVKNISRVIKGYILKSRYNGFIIPKKSISIYNGNKGVFINLNGYAEFRRIKVLTNIGDNAIVIPDKDSKPVLMEYDKVICNPNRLKSGKKI